MCTLVSFKSSKTYCTSFITLNHHHYVHVFKVKINTQTPPVGGKLGQQICSTLEQIISITHTKAPFLESHFKRREKKPQAQHYKTKQNK